MPQKKTSPWYMRWYVWAAVAFILIVAFLPTFFSTSLGNRILLNIVHSATGHEVEAKKISISWFGPQRAYEIVYKDEEQHILFTSSYAETEASLWNFSLLEEDLKIHEGKLVIQPPDLSPIVFEEIEILLNTPKKTLPLTFAITGKTRQGGAAGSFDIKGEVLGLGSSSPTGSLQGYASNLPVAGIDQILDKKGLLVEAIGNNLNLKLNASTEERQITFHLEANSPQLTAEVDAVTENSSLELKSPAKILLKVTPDFAKRLLPLTLVKPTQLKIKVDHLVCPISNHGLEWEELSLDGLAALSEAEFSELTLSRALAKFSSQEIGKKIALEIDAASPQFQLSTLKIAISDEVELTAPALFTYNLEGGQQLSANIHELKLPMPIDLEKIEMRAEVEVPAWELVCKTEVDTLKEIQVAMDGSHFSTSFDAMLDKEVFSIKNPFEIKAELTGKQVQQLFSQATLAKPAEVTVDMQPLFFPIRSFDLDKLHFEGKAKTDELLFATKNGARKFPLRDPSVKFSFDGAAQTGNLNISSEIGKGDLNLDLGVMRFSFEDFSQTVVKASGKMNEMATDFLDTLLDTGHTLRGFIGNELNFQFNLDSQPSKQSLTLNARSENITLNGGVSTQDNILQLDKSGFELNIVVNKHSSNLFNEAPFQLIKPAICSMQIKEMQWPLQQSGPKGSLAARIPSLEWNWDKVHLKGEMLVKEMEYRQFALNNTSMKFDKNALFSFNLTSDVSPSGEVNIAGSIPSDDTAQIKIDAMIKEFPTIVLDLFAHLFGHGEVSFQPIFGKTLDARVKLDMKDYNGPVGLYLTSDNTRASLSGEVQSGYLMLKEPLHAQVLMTPELSALLLQDTDILSIKEITTKSPITLEIDSNGFLWPIHPYDPNKLFIRHGKLELGKITCRNEGNLNTALGLLKFGKVGRGDSLKLWFTPLDFSISKGLLNIERTEVLIADQFDVALWGNVDLSKDYVDMVFGLTPSALQRAFGIKNLPQDYVLQIPLRGPIDDVSIDRNGATAKIALLIAWQQKALAGAIASGGAGALFGGLIDRVLPPPDFDKKAPPAKRPFPWEQPEKKKTSGKPIKKGDKPLKQLLKIIQ